MPVDLLKRADTQVLERMAVAWAQFREATILISKGGLLTRRPTDGASIRNPLLAVSNMAAAEMHACGAALGLSPVARTRITTPERVDEDPLRVLMGPNGKAWSERVN